ncbi:MAG: hypothetical protein Q9190_007606 [Brigantiaea leucoxantha]
MTDTNKPSRVLTDLLNPADGFDPMLLYNINRLAVHQVLYSRHELPGLEAQFTKLRCNISEMKSTRPNSNSKIEKLKLSIRLKNLGTEIHELRREIEKEDRMGIMGLLEEDDKKEGTVGKLLIRKIEMTGGGSAEADQRTGWEGKDRAGGEIRVRKRGPGNEKRE